MRQSRSWRRSSGLSWQQWVELTAWIPHSAIEREFMLTGLLNCCFCCVKLLVLIIPTTSAFLSILQSSSNVLNDRSYSLFPGEESLCSFFVTKERHVLFCLNTYAKCVAYVLALECWFQTRNNGLGPFGFKLKTLVGAQHGLEYCIWKQSKWGWALFQLKLSGSPWEWGVWRGGLLYSVEPSATLQRDILEMENLYNVKLYNNIGNKKGMGHGFLNIGDNTHLKGFYQRF